MSLVHLYLALFVLATSQVLGVSADTTPFRLTFSPSHAVKDLTTDLTVRCDHDRRTQSVLAEVSRIRLLKKTTSSWSLIAELRDNEGDPKADISVSVRGRIDFNIQESFLEITWPLATDEAFGTYRCDVIGFDRATFGNAAESTAERALLEENVTTDDMMDMFRDTKSDLTNIESHEDRLDIDVTHLSTLLSVLSGQIQTQGHALDSIDGKITSLSQTVEANRREIESLGKK